MPEDILNINSRAGFSIHNLFPLKSTFNSYLIHTRLKLLLIIFNLFLFLQPSISQHFAHFQEYGSREGFTPFNLSGNVVKDKTGFIWIGTDNGLYRFDGQNFKTFFHLPSDPFSLPSNNLSGVFIEPDGSFWINQGLTGITQFDPVTQRFNKWENKNKANLDINKEHVSAFFCDHSERLWILISGKGLALVNKKDRSLKLYSFIESSKRHDYYSPAFLNNIAEDTHGKFWISSNNGLVWFDPERENFVVYKDLQEGTKKEMDVRVVTNVFIDTIGRIWVSTWAGGLKKFDPVTKGWETYKPMPGIELGTKNIVYSVVTKSPNELWVSIQEKGVMIFNTITKKFIPVLSSNEENNNSIFANKLYSDPTGIIWASGGNRLTKINAKNTVFKFQPVPDDPLYGSGGFVSSCFQLVEEDSTLYIGAYYSKGFHSLDLRTGKTESFPLFPKKGKGENVNQLLLDRDNNLWVCYGNGAYIFDRQKKRFGLLSSTVINHNLLQSSIFSILEDNEGSIWFASRENGLLRYNKKQNEIQRFADEKNKMPPDYIMVLFQDSKENIWAGFHGQSGLACIPKATHKIQFYNSINFGVPKTDIAYITETKEGNIFFGLHDQGLGIIKYPLTGKDSFGLYNNYNGLSGDWVEGIARDKQDYIWISTNNGLNRCKTANMSFQYFSVADGLRRNFLESGLFCDRNGTIYAGSGNGFSQFDPALLTANKEIPRVIIHSFRINGREYSADINSVKDLFLNHKDASFSFEFSALAFTRNEQLKYAYRLKGLEDDWRYAGKNRIAAYSIPHGGDYILQIKSTNGLGEWTENVFELPIHVKPPFWETWWFILACILVVAAIIFLIFRISMKRLKASEQRKTHFHKIKADAEMKALRAQMNPHFIFNCMNTIDAYIYKNNTEAASAFLNKFSRLIRQVLENSQYSFISIQKDMDALRLYIELEEQRHEFRFTHLISIPESILQKSYKIPPLLLQPYVENAILHGLRHRETGDGLLNISFEESGDNLLCFIEDNGVGRKAAALINANRQSHQSLGSIVSDERIGLLNGLHLQSYRAEITDKADGNPGTIVKLTLPKVNE